MNIKKVLFQYKKLSCFILLTICALMVGLLPGNQQISWLMIHTSFYLVGTLVVFWCIWLTIVLKGKFRQFLSQHYAAIILAICLTSIIFFISPPRFKILADETNLVGVSMMMHLKQEAALPLECLYAEDGTPEFRTSESKRPFLFPFLLSMLHYVLGYSPSNAFYLNFLVSIGILFGIYLIMVYFRPKKYGLISMILMAGTPIYIICSTSGGFELLNLMMVIYTVYLLACVLDSDFTCWHTEFLFLTMILLANCRYESVVLIPVVGLLLIQFLARNNFFQKMSSWTMFMPLFLLPILWQRKFFMDGRTLIIRSGANLFEKTETGFAFKSLLNNIDDNIFVLMGLNPNLGFSAIVFFLAFVGFYLLMKKHYLLNNCKTDNLLITTNIVVFMVLFFLVASFHWGNFGISIDNRLALVFLPFMVWASIYCLGRLSRVKSFSEKKWINSFVALSVIHFIFFLPYGKRAIVANSLALPYEYHEVCNFMKHTFPDRENTLIITEQPNLYVIQNYACIRFVNFENYMENQDKYKNYKNIVVINKVVNSIPWTLHERWKQWHITAKPVKVIPVSKEYFIEIELLERSG